MKRERLNTAISTHTLTWSVTAMQKVRCEMPDISTHTLTWSVTPYNFNAQQYFTFQLTRSRGAWPSGNIGGMVSSAISTHTLTWSVTRAYRGRTSRGRISTHTLTWSVTSFLDNLLPKFYISTHTLTWSVTQWRRLHNFYSWISTHTLTWSVTVNDFDFNILKKFQLTRSRGAWQNGRVQTAFLCNFNSHAHVERDLKILKNCQYGSIFQLTRSRGAWHVQIRQFLGQQTFQLTRSRGAWQGDGRFSQKHL